jgi:cation transport ATPase
MTARSTPQLLRRLPRLALLAIALMAILVVLHILYMVVYGHLLNPGQPAEHYPAHALASGPWFSTIVGLPVFFLAGRRLARRAGKEGLSEAMMVCSIYLAIELAFQIGAGASFYWILVVSMLAKFLAAAAGARSIR